MKFFNVLLILIISIIFSIQDNKFNFLGNIHKDDQIKIIDIQNALNALNFENAVSNISKILSNLSLKINDLINSTLYSREEILKEQEEELFIKEMLSEIDYLKKRYKRNKIFSFIIITIILITFFYFYSNDHLTRTRRRRYYGYKNASIDNESNQLEIQ